MGIVPLLIEEQVDKVVHEIKEGELRVLLPLGFLNPCIIIRLQMEVVIHFINYYTLK